MSAQKSEKIRILIVDDHTVVREGLKNFLKAHDDMDVISEASNGREAIEQARQCKPDIILMDLVMPEMNGVDAIQEIRTQDPEVKIIALTSFSEDDKVFPAIKAGASGYLLKDVSPAELVETIRTTNAGQAHLHPDISKKLMEQISNGRKESEVEQLTPRELDVLGAIAKGLSNREIGELLFISEKTVKTHVSNILGKLCLSDRTQAAIYAFKKGLIQEE